MSVFCTFCVNYKPSSKIFHLCNILGFMADLGYFMTVRSSIGVGKYNMLFLFLMTVVAGSLGDIVLAENIDSQKTRSKSISLFKCDRTTCRYTTKYKSNMLRHRMKHNGVQDFQCSLCGRSFYHQYQLKFHLRIHHAGESLLCQHCSKRFRSKHGLMMHEKKQHDSSFVAKYKCNVCNASYANKATFAGHMNRHNNLKPFICSLCSASYYHKHHLQRHEKSCTGVDKRTIPQVGRHVCPVCNTSCATTQSLREHQDAKHSNSVVTCACGKSYKWKRCLSRHQKTCKIVNNSSQ